MTARVMQWCLNQLALNQKVGIASVVEASGSVPGKVGARLAISKSEIVGTVGGAGLEDEGNLSTQTINFGCIETLWQGCDFWFE